jgi:hypothetical protein
MCGSVWIRDTGGLSGLALLILVSLAATASFAEAASGPPSHVVLPMSLAGTSPVLDVGRRREHPERRLGRRDVLGLGVGEDGEVDRGVEDGGQGDPGLLGTSQEVHLAMNATLPLHGAVKEAGYFYSSIYLGTPPKKFTVIVDTGSTMTYIPCISCGSSCGPNHQKTHAFDPASSETCDVIDCSSPKCRSNACSPSPNNACMYERVYAERSSSTGIVLEDEMHVYDALGVGGRNKWSPRVRFGCETRETGEIFAQEVDGLLGLGNSEDNMVRQMGLKQFSLCFGLVEGEGALVLGQSPALEDDNVLGRVAFTPLVENREDPYASTYQPYYTVMMERVRVGGAGGEDVMARIMDREGEQEFSRRRRHVVLDSGTTFSYMPTMIFEAFAAAVSDHAVDRGLYTVPGPDPNFQDICFGGAGRHDDLDALESVFPKVMLTFEGGADLELAPLQYLFVHTFDSGKYCLGMFDNGEDEGFLLGGITFRNVLVTYDLENKRIGFGEASCRELGLKYRPPCSHLEGSVEDREAAMAAGDCMDDGSERLEGTDSSSSSDPYEAYEFEGFMHDDIDGTGLQEADLYMDEPLENPGVLKESLEHESEQQPALSYDDDWVFGLTRGEMLSTVMWISLGLVMAISICGTLYLAVRKTMQMLMGDRKYDRVDVDQKSADLDKSSSGPLVFSPRYGNPNSQLVSSRKSADSSRIMSGILATITSPTTAGHHAEK